MRRFLLPIALAALALALAGACREEGAAEKAGRRLDRALDELAHPNEGPLEKLGRKADEAFDSVKDALEEDR
jgi:hypothetical protein